MGTRRFRPRKARIAEARIAAELERIEARLEEQEQSFRHVLAMLIEWLEEDPSRDGRVTMNVPLHHATRTRWSDDRQRPFRSMSRTGSRSARSRT